MTDKGAERSAYANIFTYANEKNSETIWSVNCLTGYQVHLWYPHVMPSNLKASDAGRFDGGWGGYKMTWKFFKTYEDGDEEKAQNNTLVRSIDKDTVLNFQKFDEQQHFTQPPAHYTEASLVKTLEELAVTGTDLIADGMQPGKAIGETLKQLLDDPADPFFRQGTDQCFTVIVKTFIIIMCMCLKYHSCLSVLSNHFIFSVHASGVFL